MSPTSCFLPAVNTHRTYQSEQFFLRPPFPLLALALQQDVRQRDLSAQNHVILICAFLAKNELVNQQLRTSPAERILGKINYLQRERAREDFRFSGAMDDVIYGFRPKRELTREID
jgi:hypothetical protein